MKLYLSIIIAMSSSFIIMNAFVFGPMLDMPLWLNFLGVIGSVLAVITIHGLCAHFSHASQDKINPFSKYYTVSKGNRSFLIKMGVKRFKDYLPDLGFLVKFPKSKIADPNDPEYIYLYILETCSGERGHLWAALLGYLIIFLFPLKYFYCFGIPVATVNAILAILPVIALRYNRYGLAAVYKRLEVRKRNKEVAEVVEAQDKNF